MGSLGHRGIGALGIGAFGVWGVMGIGDSGLWGLRGLVFGVVYIFFYHYRRRRVGFWFRGPRSLEIHF